MTSVSHLLNIATLATWLSVAGFGVVARDIPAIPSRAGRRRNWRWNRLSLLMISSWR